MVAVAILAVIIWVEKMNYWRHIEIEDRRWVEKVNYWRHIEIEDRRERYRSLAMVHLAYVGLLAHGYPSKRKYDDYYIKLIGDTCPHNWEAAHSFRYAQDHRDYHHKLSKKYFWAAEHPGLPVEPDPPEPK